MSEKEHLLEVARAAWAMPSEDWSADGPVMKLRHRIVDFDGLEALLAALRGYHPDGPVPQEIVAEIWGLPFYLTIWTQSVEHRDGAQPRLHQIIHDIVVELHRLLGTPTNHHA
jgi:hypothetical protein